MLLAAAALLLLAATASEPADARALLQPASPSPAPVPASSDWVEGRATWYVDNQQGACR